MTSSNLPDPAWAFDRLRTGTVGRGRFVYSDAEPKTNSLLSWIVRFKRPIPEGTQPGADIGKRSRHDGRERVGHDVGLRSAWPVGQVLGLDDLKSLSLALKPVPIAFNGLARTHCFKVLLVRNDGTVDFARGGRTRLASALRQRVLT